MPIRSPSRLAHGAGRPDAPSYRGGSGGGGGGSTILGWGAAAAEEGRVNHGATRTVATPPYPSAIMEESLPPMYIETPHYGYNYGHHDVPEDLLVEWNHFPPGSQSPPPSSRWKLCCSSTLFCTVCLIFLGAVSMGIYILHANATGTTPQNFWGLVGGWGKGRDETDTSVNGRLGDGEDANGDGPFNPNLIYSQDDQFMFDYGPDGPGLDDDDLFQGGGDKNKVGVTSDTDKQPEESTKTPTNAPTKSPTKAPTRRPTEKPTRRPTKTPTEAPTAKPTPVPTVAAVIETRGGNNDNNQDDLNDFVPFLEDDPILKNERPENIIDDLALVNDDVFRGGNKHDGFGSGGGGNGDNFADDLAVIFFDDQQFFDDDIKSQEFFDDEEVFDEFNDNGKLDDIYNFIVDDGAVDDLRHDDEFHSFVRDFTGDRDINDFDFVGEINPLFDDAQAVDDFYIDDFDKSRNDDKYLRRQADDNYMDDYRDDVYFRMFDDEALRDDGKPWEDDLLQDDDFRQVNDDYNPIDLGFKIKGDNGGDVDDDFQDDLIFATDQLKGDDFFSQRDGPVGHGQDDLIDDGGNLDGGGDDFLFGTPLDDDDVLDDFFGTVDDKLIPDDDTPTTTTTTTTTETTTTDTATTDTTTTEEPDSANAFNGVDDDDFSFFEDASGDDFFRLVNGGNSGGGGRENDGPPSFLNFDDDDGGGFGSMAGGDDDFFGFRRRTMGLSPSSTSVEQQKSTTVDEQPVNHTATGANTFVNTTTSPAPSFLTTMAQI